MRRLTDPLLLRTLRDFALADCYSVRDTQLLMKARGFKHVPSIDFVWKYFNKVRAERVVAGRSKRASRS